MDINFNGYNENVATFLANSSVKVGDFVKLYIAPEKTVGSVKIVFD